MLAPKTSTNPSPKRRDRRILAIVLTLLLVFGLGVVLNSLSYWFPVEHQSIVTDTQPLESSDIEKHQKIQKLSLDFKEAVRLLHLKQYTAALPKWQQVVAQAPRMPEAQANLGFTLLGTGSAAEAESAFQISLSIRATQSNARYGLALAQAEQGRLESAIANMQIYLEIAGEKASHSMKAQALISQWQGTSRENSQ
ncbi:MAG: tetratricopeptide repeat protein [Gammaproteobacteria bacterium]|nr:tetratricopeptide repeat protein [Gammaproteobacteria bacterium]